MKKRLFISSILMTLVLLVAITTATFAWYSAAASIDPITRTQTVATAKNNVTAATVTFTVESQLYKFDNDEADAGTALLPATNGSNSTSGQRVLSGDLDDITGGNTPLWKTYVMNGANPINDTANVGDYAAYGKVDFTLTGDADFNSVLGTLTVEFEQLETAHHWVFLLATDDDDYAQMTFTSNKVTYSGLAVSTNRVYHILFWLDGANLADSESVIAEATNLFKGTVSYVPAQ